MKNEIRDEVPNGQNLMIGYVCTEFCKMWLNLYYVSNLKIFI